MPYLLWSVETPARISTANRSCRLMGEIVSTIATSHLCVEATPTQFQIQTVDASDADSCQFGRVGSSQTQGEKPQDLAKFGFGNFAELLSLVF